MASRRSSGSSFRAAIPDCSACSTSCWSAPAGNLFDDDLQPAFASAAGRWAVEQIVDLHQHRRVTPRDLSRWHYDDISAAFRAGDAAMVSDWPGSYHLYRDPATCRDRRSRRARAAARGTCRHPRRLRRLSFVCRDPHGAATRKAAAALIAPSHVVRLAARRSTTRRHSRAARARSPPSAPRPRPNPRSRTAGACWPKPRQTMIIPPRFAAYPQCEDALWRNVQRAMTGEVSPAEAVRQAAAEVAGHRGRAGAGSRAREQV